MCHKKKAKTRVIYGIAGVCVVYVHAYLVQSPPPNSKGEEKGAAGTERL